MKTRFLLVASVATLIFSGCATSTGRYPAGGPKGGPSGGGRPEQAPAPRNQGPGRSVGTVMAPHPAPVAHAPGRSGDDHPPVVNPPHQVDIHDGQPPRTVVDHRPPVERSNDPHVRVEVRRNFHPIPAYARFHPVIRVGYPDAWWGVWGIQSWDTVGTVTCEASNSLTAELYPVTAERDANGWDDDSINDLLDQAMADCAAETTDDGAECVPASPSCTFENWDGTVYRTN